MSKARREKFVILPARGISGPAMTSALFSADGRGGGALNAFLQERVGRFAELTPSEVPGLESAAPATAELSSAVADEDFEVIAQRFEDGPAVVRMTHAARLALEASYPEVRVVPLTKYNLPGQHGGDGRSGRAVKAKAKAATGAARSRKGGARAAGDLASESAVQADGTVFLDDFKQHLLAAAPGGNEGEGVLVGILDSGIDATHPALADNVAMVRCLIPGEDAAAGRPADWGAAAAERAGHGTHVAGIVAAVPGTGGPAGVAPRAKLIGYRIFPDFPAGPPKPAQNSVIIDSIRAAIDDGCHIINLSIEGSTLKEDGVRSAIDDAWNSGVLCIAAAGNGYGNPVSYPAALPHCVAVTAIGREGAFPNRIPFTRAVSQQRASSDSAVFLASFSNYGPKVQFTAPGHAIVSTFPNGGWWFSSGTSMAAPFITGLLARLLSDNGNILNAFGDAGRSAAMLQMLVGRARLLGLPQAPMEGYGLPI